jgi:hypothetical protein
MAPPVDVAGPWRPSLSDVEAPPRSRSSLSSMAEVESEPPGRARRRPSAEARAESEPWGRVERSSSSSGAVPESEPWVGRSGVRRLPGLCPSPSPGSGGADFVVFRGCARVRALGRAERSSSSSGAVPEFEPWVGRSGVCRLPGLCPCPSPGSGGAESVVFRGCARVRALGRAERSSPWRLRLGLAGCQPHSVEWRSSRCGAGGAVLLSDRSVGRRSDCGHFGFVDWRACVRIKVSGHLRIECSCDLVGWRGDLAKVASRRRLGLGRAECASVAGGGPRARRRSSGVGCPCPRLGSGEA